MYGAHLRRRHHHPLPSPILNGRVHWGTTDDFTTSFFHFFMFSTALCDLVNSRPVHFLVLSSHFFVCLPCLLPPFTVPCKMVLARPDELETCPYYISLRLLMMVRRSSCAPLACWILAQTSLLVTWSLYEMRSFFRYYFISMENIIGAINSKNVHCVYTWPPRCGFELCSAVLRRSG